MSCKIYSCTNFRYVEVAEYWSRHMQKLGLDYTIYCTDEASFEYLTDKNVKCNYCGELFPSRFNFNRFGLVRFKILEQLLEQHNYVIYSDLDAIWIENPMEDIHKEPYDAHVSTVHHSRAYPPSVRKRWGMTICTGWMGFSKSCRSLILDFISNYNRYRGNDQRKFNEYLCSLNNTIDKNIENHSFVLNLKQYNIDILGLNKDLVHRGGVVDGAKVVHPLTKSNKANHIMSELDELIDSE